MTDDQIRNIDETSPRESSFNVGRIIALLALIVFLVFVLQNTQDSNVELLWMTVNLPVWLVAVILFVLGVIVGYYSKSRKVRAKRKALK